MKNAFFKISKFFPLLLYLLCLKFFPKNLQSTIFSILLCAFVSPWHIFHTSSSPYPPLLLHYQLLQIFSEILVIFMSRPGLNSIKRMISSRFMAKSESGFLWA